jgi:hypothetical protein
MGKWVGAALVAHLLALFAGSAQALPVSSASIESGAGCSDAMCGNLTLTWSASSGSGGGSLTLSGSSLSFAITIGSATFVPVEPATDDNGVSELVFSSVTYTGTATAVPNEYAPGLFDITSGSASITGTQTPIGAGSAGPFSVSDSLLSGYCYDAGALGISCGITFSSENDFSFPLNGATRYFTHTVNVAAAAVPEPGAAALLGLGLAALLTTRHRR